MELSSLIAKNKEIEIDFPGKEGFKIKICFLGKETMRKIGEKSKTLGFDPKTRLPDEQFDDELFTQLYIDQAIIDWKGLKIEYLADLVLLEDTDTQDAGLLPYSKNNALMLVTNSRVFDNWLSSVMSDISLFNKRS